MLTESALVFSQDYHIAAVRTLLADQSAWRSRGLDATRPAIAAGHMGVVKVRRPGPSLS